MPTERTESTEVRLLQGGALVPKCTNVARSALTLRKLPQNARNPQKFRVSREETTESVVKILILSGGLRSPSNRVAFAVQSGCVRRPIGLRSPSNRVAFAVRLDRVRCPIRLRPPYDDRTIAFIAQKQWFHRTKSAISSSKSSGFIEQKLYPYPIKPAISSSDRATFSVSSKPARSTPCALRSSSMAMSESQKPSML